MADKKISQLTTLAQADVAVTADFLPIVDTSATETKKATPQALVQAGATGATLPVALGAVGTPSYTFTGDLNTGMWSPAADTLAFSEGGVEAMRIDSSGNVGIGTASPGARVHAQSAGGAGVFNFRATTTNLVNPNSTGSEIIGAQISVGENIILSERQVTGAFVDRTDLAFVTNTGFGLGQSEKMRLDASGNLGIGTASPAARLQVKTQTNANAAFANSTSVVGGVKINCFNDAGSASSPFELDASTLQFNIAAVERMRLDSSGNLGIGTASPGAKLQVIGTTSDQIRVGTAATEHYRIGRSASDGLLDFYGSQTGFQGYRFGGIDGTWAVINSSGNLGIGTASPTALLDVNADTMRLRTARTPASATAAGNAGDICWDANYLYICTATNTWRRIQHATW